MSTISRLTCFAASFAVLALMTTCAGGKTDRQMAYERAKTYVTQHPETDRKFAAAIRELDLLKGMTPMQVRAA